jgi:O-succinylbenzoic acid--CoA ligase
MPNLVALDLPGGPAFVRALQDAWDAGDAVAPLDRRLAAPARRRLLEMLRPAWVLDERGRHRYDGAEALDVEPGDALVMATSGSSGEPKGVVLTHTAIAASANATSARLGIQPRRHRWLACLPLSHIGGLAVVIRALLTGTGLEVHDGFDAKRALAASGPDVFVSLVPTALCRVSAAHFAKVVLGGSAPPGGLPANVVTTYGLTETGSGVVYDGVPLEGVEVSLSRQGEVRLRAPMLLRCYRDGKVPLDAEGWFATGDIGHFDDAGRLQVDGRLTDMIVSGGENIWPAAVEAVLTKHPGVAEVALSSKPDPEWGERVVACVVPTDPSSPPELSELRALVRDHLAAFAAPKELVLLDALPKTAIGKLRRDEMRRRLVAAMSQHQDIQASSQLDAGP